MLGQNLWRFKAWTCELSDWCYGLQYCIHPIRTAKWKSFCVSGVCVEDSASKQRVLAGNICALHLLEDSQCQVVERQWHLNFRNAWYMHILNIWKYLWLQMTTSSSFWRTKLVELSMPFKERCQKKKISFVGVFLLFGWFGFPCWFVFKCRVNSFVVFKVCVV